MKTLKNFFCNADPIDITGCTMIILVLGGAIAMVGTWTFVGLMGIAIVICALAVLLAFGVFKLVQFLQSKCG